MLRVLHTSDWHLGHTLHGRERRVEHEAFLGWLLDQIEQREVHALIVAGDVYESANPPASAQQDFYAFLAELARRRPDCSVVVVGGNHDSAGRLEAPAPILAGLGVHVVGAVARHADGQLDPEGMLVPLRGCEGVEAWVAAVPFLRAADLPPPPPGEEVGDPLVWGVAQVYRETLACARARREEGQALIGTGHCYMTGGALSELSERKILGGNQHALPLSIFDDDVDYVALGHLHLAQAIDAAGVVRYCGSPIPLSVSEREYEHQVLLVDFDEGELQSVVPLAVPRHVDILRVPEDPREALELGPLLAALESLDLEPELPETRQPWLEVRVRVDAARPSLRAEIEAFLEGRPVRLLRVGVERRAEGGAYADFFQRRELDEVEPVRVFVDCVERRLGERPDKALLEAFAELVDEVESEAP